MKLLYKIVGAFLSILVVAIGLVAIAIGYTADCEPAPAVSEDAQLMKAIVYRCYGSPEVLEYADVEKPVPSGDEILVRVRAAAVNPLDWHYMRGSPYIMRLDAGLGAPAVQRLGVDFAGVVEAVGNEVTRFKPGDEVFGGRTGAFADYVVVREDGAVALKPGNVTFEQAASSPIAGLTALQALRDHGKVRAGSRVLINGASGGVGSFAVQIAKQLGAEVTGVCSTRNVELVLSIGADRVIDYKNENYIESDERYDVIVDMVGNHGLLANTRLLEPDGILILVGGPKGNWIGPLAGPVKALLLSPFLDQHVGMMLGDLTSNDLAVFAELMRVGDVRPVIDRSYQLHEVADAIRYSEMGRARGKILINVPAVPWSPL
jgi:NADPH:quinone reductase-like Zn-dependent oxidoreductase